MSNIKTQWQNLLKKDMSRKEFLGFMGMTGLTLLGIGPILRFLEGGDHATKYPPVNSGYSSDGYSGFVGDKSTPGTKTKGFD